MTRAITDSTQAQGYPVLAAVGVIEDCLAAVAGVNPVFMPTPAKAEALTRLASVVPRGWPSRRVCGRSPPGPMPGWRPPWKSAWCWLRLCATGRPHVTRPR